MKRMQLLPGKALFISGKDFFGNDSSVVLEHADQPGWYIHKNRKDIPITTHTLLYDLRRVVFESKGVRVNVVEHLLALRLLLGLDSIRIIPKSKWIPYGDSSARIFYDALTSHVKGRGGLVPHTVSDEVREIREKTGASILYRPGVKDTLSIRVRINYHGLGEHTESYSFPGTDIERIAYARTQGWPGYLWYGTWALPFLKQHRSNAVWPHDADPQTILKAYADHRVLDILGALSGLCPPGGTLVGEIESDCGGHSVDISLIRKAHMLLRKA